jgi:putative hydroxymethylpyrimidine transport system substrate-binding protein
VTLALALVGAFGCGEKEEGGQPGRPETFELLLDFFPNADHAGIYGAEAGGHLRDVRLDLKVRQPSAPSEPIAQVAAGRVDLAVSYEPEVLRARDRELPVVAVGALVQRPLTSIISLPDARIRRPRDLAGRTVGTAGIDYQGAFLRTILARAGVDSRTVEQRDVGFDLSRPLIARRVDATLGGFFNYEGTDLRLRDRDPRIIRVDEAGVPTYDELVFVANEKTVEEEPDKIRRFLAAVERGTVDLRRNPGRVLRRGLLSRNRDLDPKLQRAVVEATLPLFDPPRGRPYGYQDPGEWGRFARWMRDNRLLSQPPEETGPAFTNDLLPGSGP